MKYLIFLSIIFIFSCKDKGYKFKKYHDVLYEGQCIAIPEYYRRIVGYDSVQFIDFMDKPEANFCYPNKWQFEKIRDTVVSYNPSRCKIKKIGMVYKENGAQVVAGWSFDCSGVKNDFIGSAAVPSENLVGGWTVTQLKYISQFQDTGLFTPKEFVIEDWPTDTIYLDTPLYVPQTKNKKK